MAKPRLNKFQKDLLTYGNIGVDSMIFIYHFADHPQYAPLTNIFFDALENNKITAVTSIISLIEILIKPEREKELALVEEYEKILYNFPNLEILPIDESVARLGAKLRGHYSFLKTPDAIQLSVALLKDCKAFLTNDEKLKRIKEIHTIVLQNYL